MPKEARRNASRVLCIALLVALTVLSVVCIDRVSQAVLRALDVSVRVIIPSLFPFAVLADLLVYAIGDVRPSEKDGNFLRFFLGVPRIGLLPFFLGMLCGFPIGIKTATELYRRGLLDSAEFAQAVCFVNNTSPAFLIGGVGIGLLASAKLGILFYVIQMLSAVLCGFLFARIRYIPPLTPRVYEEQQSGGLIGAIRRSALSCLWIAGSVSAFSVLLALIGVFIKEPTVRLFIASFTEIGTATAEAGTLFPDAPTVSLLAICIATVFGGASVHLQTALFLPQSKSLFRYYIGAKLCQTAIAVLLLLLFFSLFT